MLAVRSGRPSPGSGTLSPAAPAGEALMDVVYALLMLKERLQVLVRRDQRRRLEAEARRRRMSVGALVRDAIDASLGGIPEEERIRAVAEIRALRGGRFLPPSELERIVGEEREAVLRPSRRAR
ncbi:MAG: hypothetical protein ACRDF0_09905 [Candidatus Limnocylindria bacterium]